MGMGRTLNERRWSFWLILCVSCPYHTALFPGNAIHWPQLPCKFLLFSIKSSAGVYDCVSGNKWYVTRSLSEEGLHVIQSVLLLPNLKLHVTGLCYLPSCFAVSFRERETPIDPWEIKKTLDASSLSLFSSSDTGSFFLDFLWLVTGNSRAMHFTGKSSDSPRLVLSLLTPKDFLLTLCSKWSKETKK